MLAALLEDVDAGAELDEEPDWAGGAASEANRVAELLEALSKPLGREDPIPQADGAETAHRSDDSDGEDMSREVEDVLAQALAAAKLDAENAPDDPSELPDSSRDTREGTHEGPSANDDDSGEEADGARPELSLPSVPSSLGGAEGKPAPRVPGDFERDMLARMAALRAPPTQSLQPADAGDELALPSVPTGVPTSKPRAKPKAQAKAGFTDQDMETWCVACLEDGTLICPGCDDDVFCSRCWHDMHLGPSAGYAERSHRPKQFRSDNTKKRIAVGTS